MMLEEFNQIGISERERQQAYRYHLRVCGAAGCLSCGSGELKEALEKEVDRQSMTGQVEVKSVGCLGLCTAGPLVQVEPGGVLYQQLHVSDATAVVASLASGPAAGLCCPTDQHFFSRQTKIVLENCGRIDPERIEEYIACQGYTALYRALRELTPREIIDEITASGLRGRGGAGYPTGLKWTTVSKAISENKFVICNGDEGDPGAFMDRSVLESDPHRVLEGMIIAGYATGAHTGFIYVRAEYPLAVKRLRKALSQAERLGILGKNIFNSGFGFDIQVRLGAGAFVCGEETALIASIEGRTGRPRSRPPYPAESGLKGYPTLINNVETLANIAPIIRHGGDWFSSIGTEKSKGTKVFALAGRVRNTGLIEVPMGTSLRDIVFEIGGGIPGNGTFKAVQTGGPSGGCVPAQYLDMPVDYESLAGVGSIMGSGGMIVMDQSSCMVDVARFFMEFCRTESCGKCLPCRVGTAQIHNILSRIASGFGRSADLAAVEELCDLVKNTSLCGLGQTAPNPVLSTLRYFREEYLSHIEGKRCLAGSCLVSSAREVL
ncbi:NuoF family protein [Desulfopila aestuarii]|uniref:NAD(P)-dependent nickel-iron dehydrogenase flavin-containing subunit n=1 Tax=Desulfopila aestuarii DSM 18488 TaxID=1121416 RepID=A0A1M7YKQ3_9BACT|nr:NuoF family protein [Desulfopila aestuarii]SHO53210.1 NAD(P)-dependent nickel-iron dehydrogenase flavin-containing subunit [Desulfopila aestuarii DSM 18488]